MSTQFYPGKRLSLDGQLCTIRYYGEVKGTKGEWLGVEWDDPTRGKHSGQHGGIQYFECLSSEPTAASFIRTSRKPEPLRTFVDALKAKYASENYQDPAVQTVFATHAGSNPQRNQPVRISGKEVEEVGFDKIRKQLADLSELKHVILDGLCMARPNVRLSAREEGEDTWPTNLSDVRDACPKTIELDLSRNLFEEWREVASICEQLERLRSLRVDGNRFKDTTLTSTEFTIALKAFQNIRTLKLDSNLLPWDQLAPLTTQFPALTILVASSNNYTTLVTPTPAIPTTTLTNLSLEDNNITSISSLAPLSHLPNLNRLILKSNSISSIHSSADPPTPTFSPSLREVDLSYNAIPSWSFIDALPTNFPGLTSLRISHNPLYNSLHAPDGRPMSADDGYMLTLARLSSLTVLNFSPISEKERLNAESYYLSLIAKEVEFAPEDQAQRVLENHPRWGELCEEYGEPVVRRKVGGVNPNSLAARLVRLRIYVKEREKENGEEQEKNFELEVPKSITAYTLLGMVGKKIGVRPMSCRLVWETGDWMHVQQGGVGNMDEEDESEEDGEEEGAVGAGSSRVMREVGIVPGTRSVGTWIDGSDAVVRVEIK